MIETPKQLFLKSETAKVHRSLVQQSSFRHAVDTALLQLVLEGNSSGDWLQGAKDYIRILLSLADEPRPARPVPIDNLKHT